MSQHHWLVCVFQRGKILLGLLTALLPAEVALGTDKEPFAVFELGGAAEWGLNAGGSAFGATAAIEFNPIKNWLEIETGTTALFSRGQTEWDTDFVFKKPFDLSPTVEFEPGIGPVWFHTSGGGRTTDALGVEAVADFMFWPTPDRKFGNYVLDNGTSNVPCRPATGRRLGS